MEQSEYFKKMLIYIVDFKIINHWARSKSKSPTNFPCHGLFLKLKNINNELSSGLFCKGNRRVKLKALIHSISLILLLSPPVLVLHKHNNETTRNSLLFCLLPLRSRMYCGL